MVRELTTTDIDVLIEQHIGPHPSDYGIGRYWIEEPGVPVWAVVGSLPPDGSHMDEVARWYHLTREQVEAAWSFYGRHRAEIDAIIALNQPD